MISISSFVRNCLEAQPAGYVTTMFRRYTGSEIGDISFIGRQESLRHDLVQFLGLAGERFDRQTILNSSPRNVRGEQSVDFTGFTFDLARQVLRAEREIIERFY